jgi:hypothetical protein
MDEIPKLKEGETQHRWHTAIKDKAFDSIRNLIELETQAIIAKPFIAPNRPLRGDHGRGQSDTRPAPLLPGLFPAPWRAAALPGQAR